MQAGLLLLGMLGAYPYTGFAQGDQFIVSWDMNAYDLPLLYLTYIGGEGQMDMRYDLDVYGEWTLTYVEGTPEFWGTLTGDHAYYFKAAAMEYGGLSTTLAGDAETKWNAMNPSGMFCTEFPATCDQSGTTQLLQELRAQRSEVNTWGGLLVIALGVLWGTLTWNQLVEGAKHKWSGS